jgi:hypothetical protein
MSKNEREFRGNYYWFCEDWLVKYTCTKTAVVKMRTIKKK